MKTLGNFAFPENVAEAEQWTRTIRYRALHSRVLIVATTRIEGAWKAYCAPVDGQDHEREAVDESYGPLHDGDDIGEPLARFLFPDFAELPYAR